MEVNELSLDNILGTDEIDNLFLDTDNKPEEQKETTEENSEENKKEKSETTEVNVDTLFTNKPEGVGSEDIIEGKEDTVSKRDGTSQNNFYSSIANALADEGIFPDLDDDVIKGVKTPEDLRDLVDKQINSGLEERQKRVLDALNAGVEDSTVSKFENVINYLGSIKDEDISNEEDNGETLRKQLIFQDFINRGYKKERAEREVKKSFDAGTDIEDAREALKSNQEFFKGQYQSLIDEAREEEEKEVKERKERAEKLKTSIMEDKKVFGDIDLDKNTRKKIYENIANPVYKDEETGEYLTAIQKYESEHRIDFLKNIGLIFTLTDGFKDLNGLVKSKVNKGMKRGLRELEHTLNNTARTSDGNIKFVSGVEDDPESIISKGWSLDV